MIPSQRHRASPSQLNASGQCRNMAEQACKAYGGALRYQRQSSIRLNAQVAALVCSCPARAQMSPVATHVAANHADDYVLCLWHCSVALCVSYGNVLLEDLLPSLACQHSRTGSAMLFNSTQMKLLNTLVACIAWTSSSIASHQGHWGSTATQHRPITYQPHLGPSEALATVSVKLHSAWLTATVRFTVSARGILLLHANCLVE